MPCFCIARTLRSSSYAVYAPLWTKDYEMRADPMSRARQTDSRSAMYAKLNTMAAGWVKILAYTHTHWHSNYYKMQKNGVQDQFSVWVPAEMVSIMSLLRPKCSAGIRSAEEMHGILPGPQMHFVVLGSPLLMNAKATHDISWYVMYDTVRTTTIYMDAQRC